MKRRSLLIALLFVLLVVAVQVQAISEEAAPGDLPSDPSPAVSVDPEPHAVEHSEEAVLETTPQTEKAPRLVFEELEHDFGEIKQQLSVQCIFTFHNKGDALLVIDKVKPSCGCTGTLLSAKEIPPGGKGEIEVTFRPGLQGGKKKKAIYVYSNDPQSPTTRLYVAAEIVVPVEVRPRQINWMADRNEPSQRIIELFYQPELNIKIVGLETSSPAFTATATPKTEGEKPGYDIELAFDGTLPGNRFTEKLIITTDNADHPTLQVFIRGSITGKVKIVPNAVALGVIKSDVNTSRSIRVYTKDTGMDFEIISIEPSSPLISTDIAKDADVNGYRVSVSLTGIPPTGAFSERLLITTNVKDEPPAEVAVYAFVKGEQSEQQGIE